MKLLLPIVIISTAIAGIAAAQEEISDQDLGLSQTSVFDTPEPQAFGFDGSAPAIPAMNSLEVPVIPHETRDFEKITIGRNRCLRCHLLPELIGTTVPAGDATPIPADHYLDNAAGPGAPKVAGGRWVCTQCHVPQANTEPLVGNTTVE